MAAFSANHKVEKFWEIKIDGQEIRISETNMGHLVDKWLRHNNLGHLSFDRTKLIGEQ